MKKTVYICGTAISTRHLIDWNHPDADYWVFNESAYVGKDPSSERWTKDKPISGVFQMHTPEIWKSDNGGHYPGYYQWLQQEHGYPIFMQDHYAEIPNSVRYPLADIAVEYLHNFYKGEDVILDFFTSTAAYAVALALFWSYDEIHLCGIEMGSSTEYARQRDCMTFWMGMALGKGVNVILQAESQFLKHKIYGYTGEVVIQRQRFEIASAQMAQEVKRLETVMFEAQGAVKATLDAMMLTTSQADGRRLQKVFLEQLNEAQESVFQYGAMAGKLAENNRYMAECDALIEAAGGANAEKILTPAEVSA